MTSRLVATPDSRLLPWAAERIGIAQFRNDAKAIGREVDGRLVAVVVYDGFTSTDCNVHLASDGSKRWMTRELLFEAFAYPFIQLGFRRITGLVKASDTYTISVNEHFGWRREGLHRMAADDGTDIISMGMLRSECRFIPQEFRYV